jgi:hypothetical protein
MTSSYPTAGYSSGVTTVVQSLTSNTNNLSGTSFTEINSLLNKTPALKKSLEDFWLVKLIIGIFESAIKDVINGSNFEVSLDDSVTDYEKKTKEINDFIQEIGFKSFINKTLSSSLYWGSYVWYIDYEKKRLVDLINPTDFLQIRSRHRPVKYIKSEALIHDEKIDAYNSSEKFTDFEGSIVRAEKIAYISFNPQLLKNVPRKVDDKISYKKDHTQDEWFLEKQSVAFSYYGGKGLCDDILMLLGEYLIKYLLQYLMSLKVNIRPDILIARLADKTGNVKDVTEAVQAIEDCVNNSDSDVSIFNLDITRLIYQAQQVLSNPMKVVPGLQNYSDFQLLEYPDWKDKLDRLNSDMDGLLKDILGKEGIPIEMVDGTSSSRWESIQRSSRLMSTIEGILDDITVSIKQLVKSYFYFKNKSTLSDDVIHVNLDSSNIIYNTAYNTRIQSLTDKVNNVVQIFSNYDSLATNNKLNQSVVNNWLRDQLSTVDSKLSDALLEIKYENKDESKFDNSDINSDPMQKSNEEFEESL